MQIDLSKKTALITGSGRGIGRACAIELAKSGANIIINDRPESPDLAKTKLEIQKLGVNAKQYRPMFLPGPDVNLLWLVPSKNFPQLTS